MCSNDKAHGLVKLSILFIFVCAGFFAVWGFL